jgi:hypothetical protein
MLRASLRTDASKPSSPIAGTVAQHALYAHEMNRVLAQRALVAFGLLAFALPTPVRAETLNLVCTETDTTGWVSGSCAPNCSTVALAIDITQGIAAIPQTLGDAGSYKATVTESSVTWASEHDDFELSRYTGILRQTPDPKHGEEMIAMGYNWKCSPTERQF